LKWRGHFDPRKRGKGFLDREEAKRINQREEERQQVRIWKEREN